MPFTLLLLIIACLVFLLDALRIPASVSWTPLGFALVVASWIAGGAALLH